MIAVDTSAMLAILLAEEEAPAFRDLMGEAGRALVSAGTAIEFAVVASRDDDLFAAALAFLNEPFIDIEPVSAAQAAVAMAKAITPQVSIWAISSPMRLPASEAFRFCSKATTSHRPISKMPRVSMTARHALGSALCSSLACISHHVARRSA